MKKNFKSINKRSSSNFKKSTLVPLLKRKKKKKSSKTPLNEAGVYTRFKLTTLLSVLKIPCSHCDWE